MANIIKINTFGTVNIDNINKKDYELIQEILTATQNHNIHWKEGSSLFNTLKALIKTNSKSVFSATYKNYLLNITYTLKDKIIITVKNNVSKKVIIETFIPHIYSINTHRSLTLNTLYTSVKNSLTEKKIAS